MEVVLWTGHCGKDMRGSVLGLQVPFKSAPRFQVLTPSSSWRPEGGVRCWVSVSGAHLPRRVASSPDPGQSPSREQTWLLALPRQVGNLCASKPCGARANQGTPLPTLVLPSEQAGYLCGYGASLWFLICPSLPVTQ